MDGLKIDYFVKCGTDIVFQNIPERYVLIKVFAHNIIVAAENGEMFYVAGGKSEMFNSTPYYTTTKAETEEWFLK